ncbi:MAG: hypothetical protein H8E66_00820 [Planctomycetes bacterium]|nr:hypothetical protein [Planctomycetota bacterium]
MPSRESLLSAVVVTTTLLPTAAQADQPQPSLFQRSTAAQARPIREATEPVDAQWADIRKRRVGASSTALRWQPPKTATRVQPASHIETVPTRPKQVANKVLVWGQDDARTKGSQVRLVTQLGPIDPFDDPFGDRAPQFEEPNSRTFISQPEAQAVPLPAPEASPAEGEVQLSPSRDDTPPPAPLNDSAPQRDAFREDTAPEPPETNERGFRDPIIPPSQRYQPAAACEHIYNERNCCTDGERCQNARRYVRENTIDKISLNISPSYKPDATTDAEADQDRSLKLAQSAIRSWRNRDGQVVARGQFTNVEFGRVCIESDGKVQKIPVGQLSDEDWCFLAAWWGVPTECSLGDDKFEQREWLASTMTWKASGACHKPLYFEEVQLERYGHTAGPVLQPALSGAHFFLNIATLPYQMGMSPPNECEYALGYYRPGSCAPWLLPPIPLSVRGALLEAGAITGGIFAIP